MSALGRSNRSIVLPVNPLRSSQLGRSLAAVLGLGLLIRLVLLIITDGNGDTAHARQVADVMQSEPLRLYTNQDLTWPYPPGYTPVLILSDLIADATGLDFSRIVRLPVIVADLGTAWLVAGELARSGRSQRDCLLAAGCIALAPVYLAVAGIHGQIDSVMMLFAVGGLVAWRRLPPPYDLVIGGLLLGVAVSIKSMAVLVVLALVFAAGTLRRAALLIASTAAVPFALLLPYLLVNDAAVRLAFSYRGLPGVGGLSLVVQPRLADFWLLGINRPPSALQIGLLLAIPAFIVLIVAATAILALRRRPAPELGAVLLLLGVYSVGVNLRFTTRSG